MKTYFCLIVGPNIFDGNDGYIAHHIALYHYLEKLPEICILRRRSTINRLLYKTTRCEVKIKKERGNKKEKKCIFYAYLTSES